MLNSRVRVFPGASPLGDDFLDAFEEMMRMVEPISRLPECLVQGNFPPTNIITDKDENFIIQMSVAGYPESGVDISFKDEHLVVRLTPDEKQFEGYTVKMKGIRSSKAEKSILIPSTKFDIQKAEAASKNGILTIKIPTKEEAKPFTIPIHKE